MEPVMGGGVQVLETALPGVVVLTPARHGDHRGFFSEVYNKETLAQVGIADEFVQDNVSLSLSPGTIRGLHFQVSPHPIAKLVGVVRGAMFDVVVDIRHGSPTFGQHVAMELSADNWRQIYVPIGFAHGFCTVDPDTMVSYKVTDHWHPDVDRGILWNDPRLAIDWPVDIERMVVSEKDQALPPLEGMPEYFTANSVA